MISDYEKTAKDLKVGVETLKDIVSELEKPGRDPRDDAPKPILRSDVLTMEDLQEGMLLKGTVRNSTDFGVFVDIGVHQDGLVHISQIADRYIKHPLDVVSIGDVVDVKVLSVDLEKKRISLTMRLDGNSVKDYREMHKNTKNENQSSNLDISPSKQEIESEIDSVKLAKEIMKNKKASTKVKISVANISDDAYDEIEETKKKVAKKKKETSSEAEPKKAKSTKKVKMTVSKKETDKKTSVKKVKTKEKVSVKDKTAAKKKVTKKAADKSVATKTRVKKTTTRKVKT